MRSFRLSVTEFVTAVLLIITIFFVSPVAAATPPFPWEPFVDEAGPSTTDCCVNDSNEHYYQFTITLSNCWFGIQTVKPPPPPCYYNVCQFTSDPRGCADYTAECLATYTLQLRERLGVNSGTLRCNSECTWGGESCVYEQPNVEDLNLEQELQ